MFRRRGRDAAALDRGALLAACRIVIDELAEDFDWRLGDPDRLAGRVAARAADLLSADLVAAADPRVLRRTLEREACAEYFADLYDDLARGEPRRTAALTALFRPEPAAGPDGPITVYRGYLYRAAAFYLLRWTGRKGWSPPPELADELARAAAEEVLIALLRGVELREGSRAFWAYLARAVERRAIDQLRGLGRHERTVSLDALTERLGHEPDTIASRAAGDDPESATATADLERMMGAAHLSAEERYALLAGAYGLNDGETAAELTRRTGRPIGPPDVRRWRFRGRDKLRRLAESDR